MKNLLNKPILLASPASIKNGDHAAFLQVYNHIHIKLFRFFFKKLQDLEAAKDLTQQTFMRLWQFRHTLSDQHPLEKQIFVIAHSLFINHLEKEQVQQTLKKEQQAAHALYLPQVDEQPLYELTDQLSTAIESLPPVRKKIIFLKAFHDYSNKEIAKQMDISVKTVEDHVTRAFRKMKQLMMFFL